MISLAINFIWWHHYHRGHADLLLLHFALLPWGSFEGGLPPSPQVLVLEGHWGLLSPGRLKLHTHEARNVVHAQQTEIMQLLLLRTRSPPMYDIHLSTCVHTCIRIHRLMHLTVHTYVHAYVYMYVCIGSCMSLTSVVSWSKRWVYLVLPERPKFFTWQQRNTQMFVYIPKDTANHQCIYIYTILKIPCPMFYTLRQLPIITHSMTDNI